MHQHHMRQMLCHQRRSGPAGCHLLDHLLNRTTQADAVCFTLYMKDGREAFHHYIGLAHLHSEPAADKQGLAADHIGLEFGFLAHLAELTIAASEIRDGAEVKRLIDAQRGFLSQHMSPWVPRWADDVINHARTELYRGLGWLARGTVLEAASFFALQKQSAPTK